MGGLLFKGKVTEQHLSGTSDGFMYNNYGPSSCKYLSCWIMITWNDLQLNWRLGAPLKFQNQSICVVNQQKVARKQEWEAYVNGYFEASKHNN